MRRVIAFLLLVQLAAAPLFAVERKQSFKVMPQELMAAALRVGHAHYKMGKVNDRNMMFHFATVGAAKGYSMDASVRADGQYGSVLVLNSFSSAARRSRPGANNAGKVAAEFFHAVKMDLEMRPARIA